MEDAELEPEPRPDPQPDPLSELRTQFASELAAGQGRSLADALETCAGNERTIARAWLDAGGGLGDAVDSPPTLGERGGEGDQEALPSLGPYTELVRIGAGGQGVVYQAWDARLRRRVALKVLSGLGAHSGEIMLRFRREALVASRLDHPAICPVYDAGVIEGTPFIAMRFLRGTPLDAVIREASGEGLDSSGLPSDSFNIALSSLDDDGTGRRAITTRSGPAHRPTPGRDQVTIAVELAVAIARGLHVAHGEGVVHRDMKPANVMIGEEGQPVLLDFGLASMSDESLPELTQSGQVLGTPAYMSPEQVRGEMGVLDARTDVWSLGVILFECLTLTRPFEAATRQGLYRAILDQEMPDPRARNRAVSRDLKVVLATALEKDLDRRYRSAAAFADDLQRVLDRHPVQARPAGPLLRARRFAERNPFIATSIAILIVASVAVGIAFLEAARSNRDYQKLKLGARFDRLQEEALLLWPARPGTDHTGWLARASELLALEDTLVAGSDDPWLEDQLDRLRGRFRAFAGGVQTGRPRVVGQGDSARVDTVASVRQRAAWAEGLTALTIDAHREAWDAAIAGVGADVRFDGFTLEPQVGLVPLGPDPRSGFQEFVDLGTGEIPTRDPASGRLVLDESSGIVFVLLPAGTFHRGAQAKDPEGRNHDPMALPHEGPVVEVAVAPFLISKFEVTQAQWKRVTGLEPSRFRPGGDPADEEPGVTRTPMHPVEQITWREANRVLRRLGLVLPTPHEWEYACRAGTDTPWSTGPSMAVSEGAANFNDLAVSRWGQTWAQKPREDGLPALVDDGFGAHAPVGSFAANAFGLHDMHGNVHEWTASPERDRHGLAETVDETWPEDRRAWRGGGFFNESFLGRSSFTYPTTASFAFYALGVRPVRRL